MILTPQPTDRTQARRVPRYVVRPTLCPAAGPGQSAVLWDRARDAVASTGVVVLAFLQGWAALERADVAARQQALGEGVGREDLRRMQL